MEPAARGRPPLEVVGIARDVVAVNKPSMMPVHSCGKYGSLSALGILGSCDPGLQTLRPVNRIDLATSGLFLAATSKEATGHMAKAISCHKTEKIYLALVFGDLRRTIASIPERPVSPKVDSMPASTADATPSSSDGKKMTKAER